MNILKSNKLSDYEIEKGKASFKTIVERFVGDIVLCNNLPEIDQSVIDNLVGDDVFDENLEIYQWYLCNLTEWEKQQCEKCGLIISYSDLLDCDVLCVNHFGTSWDYVLTDNDIVDDINEI